MKKRIQLALFLAAVTLNGAENFKYGDWQISASPQGVAMSCGAAKYDALPLGFAIEPTLPARTGDAFVWDDNNGKLCWSYQRGDVKITEELTFSASGATPRVSRFATVKSGILRNWSEAAFVWKFNGSSGNYLIPASDKGSGQYFDPQNAGELAKLKNNAQITGISEGFAPLFLEQNGVTFLFMSRGDTDVPGVRLEKFPGTVLIKQTFRTAGWLEPDATQTIGGASCDLWPGNLEEALVNAPKRYFADFAVRPAAAEEYLKDAVLYSFHPGGTVKGDTAELGGFQAATDEVVPLLAKLKFNLVWLLPLEDQSIYRPRDYRKFQSNLGSEKEYTKMLEALRANHIRVWRDIVPHGNSPSSAMLRGNSPFMLLFNEKGEVDSYWCFDFGNPEWQKYMAQIAREYVQGGQLDGLRIDAVKGSHSSNYRRAGIPKADDPPKGIDPKYWHDAVATTGGVPPLEYMRGGLTLRRGGLEMASAIRQAAREVNPRAVTLAEANEASFVTVADVIYDSYFANYTILQLRNREPEKFAKGAMRRMHEQNCLDPAGTIRLRYIENHDTTAMQGYFGVGIINALRMLEFTIPGIPMIYQDNEILGGVYLAKLIELRHALSELRRGTADYRPIAGIPDAVFSVMREDGANRSAALINFADTSCRFASPLAGREVFTGRTLAAGDIIELTPYQGALVSTNPAAANIAPLYAPPVLPVAAVPGSAVQKIEQDGRITYFNNVYRITFDAKTNTALEICAPEGEPQKLAVSVSPGGDIRWRFLPDRVELESEKGELRLTLDNVDRYQVNALDGFVDDYFIVRHQKGKAGVLPGTDYRLRGTPTVWTHETTPLSPAEPVIRAGSGKQELEITVLDLATKAPERLEILDQGGFTLLVKRDQGAITLRPAAQALVHRPFTPQGYQTAKGITLSCDGLDYLVQNDRYRFELRRNGGIVQKIQKRSADGQWQTVVSNSQFYTSRGFGRAGEARHRYGSPGCDPESGVTLREQNGELALCFTGRFRDDGRWQSIRPEIESKVTYRFAPQTVAMDYGFIAKAGPLYPQDANLILSFTAPGDDLKMRTGGDGVPPMTQREGNISFDWFDKTLPAFTADRWHRLKLELDFP